MSEMLEDEVSRKSLSSTKKGMPIFLSVSMHQILICLYWIRYMKVSIIPIHV